MTIGSIGAARVVLPLAGHLDSLLQLPDLQQLELTERHGGAAVRVPVDLPIYRMHAAQTPPKIDGRGDDWPVDNQLRVLGDMKVQLRYLSRPDLQTGSVRLDLSPAQIRWTFDQDYLYFYAQCPQEGMTDERNSEWPVQQGRWWGSDGLQVQLAELGDASPPATQPTTGENPKPESRIPKQVIQLAFKPAGVLLIRTARLAPATATAPARWVWTDGQPPGQPGAVRYAINVEKRDGRVIGYSVEAAIPRSWASGTIEGINAPAWRINILRHRAGDLASTSWSGPVVNDEDLGMMGLLVGE